MSAIRARSHLCREGGGDLDRGGGVQRAQGRDHLAVDLELNLQSWQEHTRNTPETALAPQRASTLALPADAGRRPAFKS